MILLFNNLWLCRFQNTLHYPDQLSLFLNFYPEGMLKTCIDKTTIIQDSINSPHLFIKVFLVKCRTNRRTHILGLWMVFYLSPGLDNLCPLALVRKLFYLLNQLTLGRGFPGWFLLEICLT